jgi:hypothetical protein
MGDERMTGKCILKKYCITNWTGLDSSSSLQDPAAGSRELVVP